MVLDADALTAFAGDRARLLSVLHARCVLTPMMANMRACSRTKVTGLRAPARQRRKVGRLSCLKGLTV